MQALLDKIGVIDFQYRKFKKHDNFNIFSVLHKKHDEVRLHSRFLSEVLNPDGSHGMGRVFLESFLTRCGLNPENYAQITVATEYNNIDILVKGDKEVLIIENKIWAGDQDRQIDRYYRFMESKGATAVKVLYLTPFGKSPDSDSLGSLKDHPNLSEILMLQSYEKVVNEWMDHCIQLSATLPALRETFVQYKNLIKELTGNSMDKQEQIEIADHIAQNDNILKAYKIAANWEYIHIKTEWNFWKELEETLLKHYPESVLETQHYSWQKIKDCVRQKRNARPYYGIMLKIKDLGNRSLCIFIEKGWDENFYGVTILNESESKNDTMLPIFKSLADQIKPFSEWDWHKNWLGANYLEPNINLYQFKDKSTLMLANDQYRHEFIQNAVVAIKDFIKACDLENYELPLEELAIPEQVALA